MNRIDPRSECWTITAVDSDGDDRLWLCESQRQDMYGMVPIFSTQHEAQAFAQACEVNPGDVGFTLKVQQLSALEVAS